VKVGDFAVAADFTLSSHHLGWHYKEMGNEAMMIPLILFYFDSRSSKVIAKVGRKKILS